MQALPIDPLLPAIVDALRQHPAVVLEAPPGAGKTTRVPRALLDADFLPGEILVLQPRRLPTRLAAARVAQELGERPGGRIGYAVRFEEVGGPSVRVRFITEGLLLRRLLGDPLLRGVGAVILDEFHERHLVADLSLALLRQLQRTERPDLRIAVMSATLEADPVAAWLGDVPLLRSEGRRFDVSIDHLGKDDERPLHQQVDGAVKRLLREGLDGHVLVFLPGAGEIRRTSEVLAPVAEAADLEVVPLHGDLPAAEQGRAVRPSDRRRIILSTNVAETSVTIEGVAAVIDSGLARVASHSPFSGLPTLQLAKVSQASAIQRAGRAGRTRAGRALRLYTRHDFEGRPAHDPPEIQRLDLAEAVLALHGAGVGDLRRFDFLEPPPAPALEAAEALLQQLGALAPGGGLTEIGERMLRLPVHPRLARMVIEGERRGVARSAATLAALVAERDIRLEARTFGRGGSGGRRAGSSDAIELLERFREAQAASFAPQRLRSMGLDIRAVETVDRARRQLQRLARDAAPAPADEEEALLLATLAGFPDRVAKRRSPTGREVVLAGGGAAELAESSVVHDATFLVAVAADEQAGARGRRRAVVRIASAIEPDWLLDLHGDQVEAEESWVWNAEAERVDRIDRIAFGQIALEESRQPAPPSPRTAQVLVEAALARGLDALAPEMGRVLDRLRTLASCMPELQLPTFDPADLARLLAEACADLRSFAELRQAGLGDRLLAVLRPEQQRALAKEAPARIALPGGRSVEVHYEADRPPWIESRLQDFFGMAKGPVICGGRLPLTLHLLAPNRRAVQVTQDLAGFWSRHYPDLRKQLMRRYPKHAWPEDGATATPPPKGRIR